MSHNEEQEKMATKREREEDKSGLKWLLDALECPVCLDPMLETQILVCTNDQEHSLCLECHKDLDKKGQSCPVCREPLSKKRNLGLEKIAQNAPVAWINCRFQGCMFKRLSSDSVKEHENNDCLRRMVQCGECKCQTQLNKLAAHLVDQHNRLIWAQCRPNVEHSFWIDFAFNQSEVDQIPKVIQVDNKNLNIFFNWAEVEKKFYLFWVSFGGPKKEAVRYEYTIKIISSKEKKLGQTKILAEGTNSCVPCDVTPDQMKKMIDCFVVGKKVVKRASEGNDDKLQYIIKIQAAD